MIPIEDSFAAWRKDPEYVKAYDALEDEFTLAVAMITSLNSAVECQRRITRSPYGSASTSRSKRKSRYASSTNAAVKCSSLLSRGKPETRE
jgi:hypothetical protein